MPPDLETVTSWLHMADRRLPAGPIRHTAARRRIAGTAAGRRTPEPPRGRSYAASAAAIAAPSERSASSSSRDSIIGKSSRSS